MQAKLPDINAALVRHRSAALAALKENDHHGSIVSFDSMIALLPEEYQIEINTEKYNQLVAEKKTISCTACTATPLLKDIRLYRLLLPVMSQFVSNNEYVDVWYCADCNEENVFNYEQIKITKFEEPSYFKVVPSPPSKRGTKNRMTFDYEFKKWFNIVMTEIEYQIGIYRADYQSQQSTGIPQAQEIE